MLKEFPRGLEDSSGRIAEFFLFGKVRTGDPHYQKEARDCLAITDPQAREICAIRLIRKRQPSDPKNPKKLVMKDLLFETAAFLDLKSKEELERLEEMDEKRLEINDDDRFNRRLCLPRRFNNFVERKKF